jgi:tetratricopeptide (TPR) repeat protein
MRIPMIAAVVLTCSMLAAENLEKTQKKEMEAAVKVIMIEAERLAKAGQFAEARAKYAESQALIETKDVTEALKHLDEKIHNLVRDALNDSRKLYEVHKFKESAAVLDATMRLQAFQPVLAYDLALCYYQLGDRDKAVEYLRKAKAGTADPKQKQKLSQLLTFFTTGENGAFTKDSDKERITRVNRLAESIGVEASLDDEGGEEETFLEMLRCQVPRIHELRLHN